MSISAEEVRTIARLARIHIEEQDIPELAGHLSRILAFVAQMDQADTSTIDPLAHLEQLTQNLREDEVRETDSRAAFQAIAPEVADGLYLVPKVID